MHSYLRTLQRDAMPIAPFHCIFNQMRRGGVIEKHHLLPTLDTHEAGLKLVAPKKCQLAMIAPVSLVLTLVGCHCKRNQQSTKTLLGHSAATAVTREIAATAVCEREQQDIG